MGRFSITEYVAKNFYQLMGWMVEQDVIVYSKGNKHPRDLDLLAFGGQQAQKVVHLVNCKDAGVYYEGAKDVVDNLHIAQQDLLSTRPYLKGFKIKRVFISWECGLLKKAIKHLEDNQINILYIDTILAKSIEMMNKKTWKGDHFLGWGDFRETNKLFQTLLEAEFFNEGKIKEHLKTNKTSLDILFPRLK